MLPKDVSYCSDFMGNLKTRLRCMQKYHSNISFVFAALMFLLTGIFAFTCCTGIQKKKQNISEKPNIIFILADDLGWADLPVYGNTFNEAPNLDKMALEGITFINAYAACPVCSPTRASIMSGQYPARLGVIDFIPGHWRPDEKVIVPQNRKRKQMNCINYWRNGVKIPKQNFQLKIRISIPKNVIYGANTQAGCDDLFKNDIYCRYDS